MDFKYVSIKIYTIVIFLSITIFSLQANGQCINCKIVITDTETSFDVVYIFRTSGNFLLPEELRKFKKENGDPINSFEVNYAIIGGGGGGGFGDASGGGGAGEIKKGSATLSLGNTYPVGVGAGGTGSSGNIQGLNGEVSTFNGVSARGGGGGGSSYAGSNNGRTGGSGGGGGAINNNSGTRGGKNGDFTNVGGAGNSGGTRSGGGGGGAGSEGVIGENNNAGNGGRGISLTNILNGVSPSVITNAFAGGGGGVGVNGGNTMGTQGLGGTVSTNTIGGAGRDNNAGLPGLANTGSGGGAGRLEKGGNGGSGIVILRVTYFESGILPVELVSLDATYHERNKSVTVQWVTAKEWENSHFEIERSFSDIGRWEIIGVVQGMGWTDEMSNYTFIDKELPLQGGKVYYRLKQVDFNLSYDYSKTIMISVPNTTVTKGEWRAFPNPVNDENFQLSLLKNERFSHIQVQVISSQNKIEPFTVKNIEDLNSKLMNHVKNFGKGVIVVELKWNNKVEYVKIVKN